MKKIFVGIIMAVIFLLPMQALALDESILSWEGVTEYADGEPCVVSGYKIFAVDVEAQGDPIETDVGNVTEVPLADLGLTSNREYVFTAVSYINETQANIVREVARSEPSEGIDWWYDLIPRLLKQVQNLIVSPPAS